MNDKVWIVIKNSESTEIKAVFSSKEKAERYIKLFTAAVQNKEDVTFEIVSSYLYGCFDVDKGLKEYDKYPDVEVWISTFDAKILDDGTVDLKLKALNVEALEEGRDEYSVIHNRIEMKRMSKDLLSGNIKLASKLNEEYIYNFVKDKIEDCLKEELKEYPSSLKVLDLKVSIEWDKKECGYQDSYV